MSGSFWREAGEVLELPSELLGGQLRLSICGTELIAENHQGLLLYQPQRIVMRGRGQLAELCGEQLSLVCLDREQLIVSGLFHSLSLKEDGHDLD